MHSEHEAPCSGGRTAPMAAIALALLLWGGTAAANETLIPYAAAAVEYRSNLFALSGGEQVGATAGDTGGVLGNLPGITPQPTDHQRSDILQRYLAGVDAKLRLSDQTLRGKLEGRHLSFDHFDRLDHDEYLWSAGLDWRLASIVEGIIDYRQERRMAAFADRNSTDLSLELERIANASASLAFHPDWRLEAGVRARELDSPLPAFPDFALKEKAVHTAIKYLSEDTLTTGLLLEHLEGHFLGSAGAPDFRQQTAALTASYFVSGLTRIGAEVGYTRRKDRGTDNNNSFSGATGVLSMHRELTGKTSADAQIFRRIGSYVGGASAEQQTGASVGLTWKATDRITAVAAYQRGKSRLQETQTASTQPDRNDNIEAASLQLSYEALSWLALRPYAYYQSRDSSTPTDSFYASALGLELIARFE